MPTDGIFMLESHHSSSFRMAWGSWSFHKFCWTPVGKGALELEDGRVPLSKDGFAYVPAGLGHRFVDDPANPMTLVIACVANDVIDASTALADSFRQFRDKFPASLPIRAKGAFHQNALRDAFRRMLREQSARRPGWELMLRGYWLELVASFIRGAECGATGEASFGGEQAVEALLEELRSRAYEPFSVSDAAEHCGLSTRRFSELFRERTGTTFVDYVNRQRVAYAKERLLETGHVAYACYESGFQDLAYFYRVFRKYTGCTPGGFLKGGEAPSRVRPASALL